MSRSLLLTLDTKYAKEASSTTTTSSSMSLSSSTNSPLTVPITNAETSTTIDPLSSLEDHGAGGAQLAANSIADDDDGAAAANDDDDNNVVHEYVTSSSLLGIKITLISHQRIEYALGLCSALILFTAMAAVAAWKLRCPRRSALARFVVDKQVLLQNEVVPQRDSDAALTLPHHDDDDYLRVSY